MLDLSWPLLVAATPSRGCSVPDHCEESSQMIRFRIEPETLEDFASQFAPIAFKNMLDHGHLTPVFFCQAADNTLHIIGTMFRDVGDKNAVAAEVEKFIAENKIVRYAHAMEAWVVMAQPNNPIDMRTAPSANPNRVERIVITGEDWSGRNYMQMWPIIRDGKKISIGDPVTNDPCAGEVRGRFSNFLARNMRSNMEVKQ
jgi:hypothetical protein